MTPDEFIQGVRRAAVGINGPPPGTTFVFDVEPGAVERVAADVGATPEEVARNVGLLPEPCPDCGVLSDIFYMVKHRVWAEAGLTYRDGWLCAPCLAGRLGRGLTWNDWDIPPHPAEYRVVPS